MTSSQCLLSGIKDIVSPNYVETKVAEAISKVL
jgi:hypothetical protein